MSESQKWDWKLLGKAVSLVIAIIGRIREAMGEATLAWEMMEWLAKDAPKSLYTKVWEEITNAWQTDMDKKRNRERMEKMEWIKVSVRPERYERAQEYFGPGSGGFRFPTCEELVFYFKEMGIVSRNYVWVSRNNSDNALLAFSPEIMGLILVDQDTVCDVYSVRDRHKKLMWA